MRALAFPAIIAAFSLALGAAEGWTQSADKAAEKVDPALKALLLPKDDNEICFTRTYDGTASITLLWLGRRRIAGIHPGRALRVTGRIGCHGGVRTLYNPRYDLLP